MRHPSNCQIDCNGWLGSPSDTPVTPNRICADPINPATGQHITDNGWYIGHDEPSMRFLSFSPGSANNMQYSLTLPGADPTPKQDGSQTANFENYVALWFSMSMEITTYQLASSLIAKGMDWKQAVGTVLLGNLIVLIPMLLNAHAGAKYGIPFPVFIRAPFGVRGANLPAILRAIVACGWFGIQSWIGGQAIDSMLIVIWPSLAGNWPEIRLK